jgi:hypothetical protein
VALKVNLLPANKDVDVNFSITGGADQDKFTLGGNKRSLVVVDATGAVILSGNTLTFAATDFEASNRNSNGFANGGFICFTGSNYHRVDMIASGFKVGGSKGKCVATQDDCASSVDRLLKPERMRLIVLRSKPPLVPVSLFSTGSYYFPRRLKKPSSLS